MSDHEEIIKYFPTMKSIGGAEGKKIGQERRIRAGCEDRSFQGESRGRCSRMPLILTPSASPISEL